MKKLIILIVLILAPFAATSQENTDVIVEDVKLIIQLDTTTTVDISNKRNHTYFASQKEAIKLSHKKSNDLISIKAFRKTTQLRSRQTRRC